MSQPWEGTVWLNPPYSHIEPWVRKAYQVALEGSTVVCLLPAWTDLPWFHLYCSQAEVRFVRGRLTFGDASSSARFPSMIVVFRPYLAVGSG